MTYSFTTNDKTKFKYDIEAGGIPNQTEGNSYMRIYRQIYTDKQLDSTALLCNKLFGELSIKKSFFFRGIFKKESIVLLRDSASSL